MPECNHVSVMNYVISTTIQWSSQSLLTMLLALKTQLEHLWYVGWLKGTGGTKGDVACCGCRRRLSRVSTWRRWNGSVMGDSCITSEVSLSIIWACMSRLCFRFSYASWCSAGDRSGFMYTLAAISRSFEWRRRFASFNKSLTEFSESRCINSVYVVFHCYSVYQDDEATAKFRYRWFYWEVLFT